MSVNLRFANESDVKTILSLIKDLAEFEKLSHEVTTTEEILRQNLFSKRTCAEVVLAEIGAQAVGCAIFCHNFSTFLGKPGLYLEDLFVKPEFRSLGVGLRLLEFLAKIAIERDCGRMEWSVLNWNQKAINFYERLGAKPMDEWTVYRLTGNALSDLAKHNKRRS